MVVASGITTTFHVQLIIHTLLSIITGNISLTLLADYITNKPFLTFKIIPYRICFIRCISIFEDGSSLYHL